MDSLVNKNVDKLAGLKNSNIAIIRSNSVHQSDESYFYSYRIRALRKNVFVCLREPVIESSAHDLLQGLGFYRFPEKNYIGSWKQENYEREICV